MARLHISERVTLERPMHWRVEVWTKKGYADVEGHSALSQIRDFGIAAVDNVASSLIYDIVAELDEGKAAVIARELLADSVLNDFTVRKMSGVTREIQPHEHVEGGHVIQISRKPGVMDPVEQSALKAMRDLGFEARSVKTIRKYLLEGKLTGAELDAIARKILANDVIEDVTFDLELPFQDIPQVSYKLQVLTVDLLKADDRRLAGISRDGMLSLSLVEMQTVRDHFKKLGRNPTDCELATIAQTWSEHCKHKTFAGKIDYDGELIDNLLNATIKKCTEALKKDWCISVFKDNAGVIEFDERNAICFKVETHNHPSAIEPYGGANTGLGGVIRDPLGTGMGAKPIISTDVFCFAPPDYPKEKLPPGVLHPKRIMKGVVAGVRDYGNRMGIPTTNGSIFFDERYIGNPLVYCGNVGIMPRDKCFKEVHVGDLCVAVGGRTGRDGIGGVTFASIELTEKSEALSSGAVQIGNAITEKTLVDTILQARDKGLYTAITDCGGGGFSSAIGEMGEETGVEIDLDKAPLKYEGLSYTEIWISEAQERMILAVPPAKIDEILALFKAEDVEAVVLGRFTGDHKLRLRYNGKVVCELDMEFLHKGLPKVVRKAVWVEPKLKEPNIVEKKDYGKDLHKILSSWNVCSKEWVIRQYDHEVQAGSVLKPLVGAHNDGPGDASINAPLYDSRRGIVLSNGMNPLYGDIDPYWMAASAIDEALRNLVAVGCPLERVALLDNFCWGITDKPDRLGALVRAAKACHDFALLYGTPFISGKDSLNNEFTSDSANICIPHSLLISAIGVMPDVDLAVSMDFKKADNHIYIVGLTKNELGGSHYYHVHGQLGKNAPKVEKSAKRLMDALSSAMRTGLVRACHDCSEGGLAVAVAEMCFAGGFGASIDLARVPVSETMRDDMIMFSESNTRFICEVEPDKKAEFEKALKGRPFAEIGRTVATSRLVINGAAAKKRLDEDIWALKESWQAPLHVLLSTLPTFSAKPPTALPKGLTSCVS
jgi:phosphoribosylformylglycinamidine synthase